MGDILVCSDLVKQHRGRGIRGAAHGTRAVDGVSFSVPRNTTFGLVGESGCGKTSLARAVLYLDPPSAGSVVFDGTELGGLSAGELRRFRRRMQIVFQDPNGALDPKMTVHASMAEGLVNRGIASAERETRIKALLDRVGISWGHKDRFPHEFSGGQKQRIVVARALSMEPELLVLDEPVSNLDVSIQAQIINLLLDLKDEFKLTYLFISHNLTLVSYFSDVIAVMFKGRIVEMGPSEAVVANPVHPYTRRLFESVPGAARAEAAASGERGAAPAGTAEGGPAPAGACPYLPACPLGDGECEAARPALVDIGNGHVVSCFKARRSDERSDL